MGKRGLMLSEWSEYWGKWDWTDTHGRWKSGYDTWQAEYKNKISSWVVIWTDANLWNKEEKQTYCKGAMTPKGTTNPVKYLEKQSLEYL